MTNFKIKPVKTIKPYDKYETTLDNKHKEHMSEFAINEQNLIPKLKDEKEVLKTTLLSNKNLSVDDVMEIKDKINEIKQKIKSLKIRKNKYFADNSKYIFEYFENKQNIGNDDANIHNSNNTNNTNNITSNNSANNSKKMTGKKNKEIHDFFKLDASNSNSNSRSENDNKTDNENQIATINDAKTATNKKSNNHRIIDRYNVVQKYMANINGTIVDMNDYVVPSNICQDCHKGELMQLENEGVLLCNMCSAYTIQLIENEKHSYKEPPKEICFYAYKKINHFKEILAQFQGKETTYIEDHIIAKIENQIKKERITLNELTYNKTKEILKILGFNKSYEHIAYIKNKLGIKPPIFSAELETTLCNLFIETQAPYSKVCPDDRINFLNYYYILYKLCELLGEYQYLKEIPMLKDEEKIIEQDEIWKNICAELEWNFIRTDPLMFI